MKCPKCKIVMVEGIAINSGGCALSRAIVFVQRTIKAKDLKLIKCLKCPVCGHSDDDLRKLNEH